MIQTVFIRVFKNGWYLSLALAIFVVGMSLVLLLPNLALITQVFLTEGVALGIKLKLYLALYGSLFTNFTLASALITLGSVFLFSINIALLIFYIRRAQKGSRGIKKAQASSFGGLIAGILGIGCAACGSVILSSLAVSLGAVGLLAFLPLHGGEFALLGIVFLLYSIFLLVKKINDPLVCIPE